MNNNLNNNNNFVFGGNMMTNPQLSNPNGNLNFSTNTNFNTNNSSGFDNFNPRSNNLNNNNNFNTLNQPSFTPNNNMQLNFNTNFTPNPQFSNTTTTFTTNPNTNFNTNFNTNTNLNNNFNNNTNFTTNTSSGFDDFNPRSNLTGFNQTSINLQNNNTLLQNNNNTLNPSFNPLLNNGTQMNFSGPTLQGNLNINTQGTLSQPTSQPLSQPLSQPTSQPLSQPTSQPSSQPSFNPTPHQTFTIDPNSPLPNSFNELKEILRQERLKNSQILQEKTEQINKWSLNLTQLKDKNQTLVQKIQEAKLENERLKQEYSLLISNNESEMKLLCNIQMKEILQKYEKEIEKFHGSGEGNTLSNIEDLEKKALSIEKVLYRLEEAAKSNLNDIILSELDDLVDEISSFLDCAKGVAKTSNNKNSGTLLALANKLASYELFKDVLMNPTDSQKSSLLIQTMRSLLSNDLKNIFNELKKSDNDKGLELQELADKELFAAAERIKKAALSIANAKNNVSISYQNVMSKSQIEVCEHLLGSTEKIALITGQLVYHASLAQKERTSNENTGQFQVYRKSAIWVNGLISCVHSVADRINSLVEIANKVVSGEKSWEYIVSASEEVQMFGVQLVTASRAKLSPTSENRRNLENTQVSLNIATKELINSAKTYKVHTTPQVTRKKVDPGNSIQAQTQLHNQVHLIDEEKNKLLEAEKTLQKMLASHDIFEDEDEENKPNIMVTLQDRAKTLQMMVTNANELKNIIQKKVLDNQNNHK